MKIVILDGYSANPGDLSWKELEEMGELTVYERTKASETVARTADAEMILTNKVVINREVMAHGTLCHRKPTRTLDEES